MRVLAHAIEQAGTTVPERVAHVLRTMAPWEGVTGTMAFDDNGDLIDDMLIAKVVRKGQFEYLEALADHPETPQSGDDMAARAP